MKALVCVVLAAGEGRRMRSGVPKVLHRLNGVPMLHYIVGSARALNPEGLIVVAGKDNRRQLEESLGPGGVRFVTQEAPLGTAHALQSARKALRGFRGDVLVLNGDTPLITTGTLKRFITRHRRAGNSLSILSFTPPDPAGYGRVLRDGSGRPLMIVEEPDATVEQRGIGEVNSGVYLIRHDALPLLKEVRRNRRKKEYYLTDLLGIALRRGLGCGVYQLGEEREFMGVNTKEELLQAQRVLRERTVKHWLDRDVGFMDESAVFIHPEAVIGEGTFIYPNVCIEGKTRIGRWCVVYPNVRIAESVIGDRVVIKDSSVIESAEIGDGSAIGPFARLRPGTTVMEGASIGNFVEVKASTIGRGTKAQHHSYIGDAEVGGGVNIGAGTITCNYDGLKKHKTVIEEGVFIGSDTQLVAPVRIGKGAYVAAGTTVTEDVPPGALAIGRAPGRVIKGWAKKRRAKS